MRTNGNFKTIKSFVLYGWLVIFLTTVFPNCLFAGDGEELHFETGVDSGEYVKSTGEKISVLDISNIEQYEGEAFSQRLVSALKNQSTTESILISSHARGNEGFSFNLGEPWKRAFSFQAKPLGCIGSLSGQ